MFSSLVGLWAFNMVSYPIGKPLDPVFSVVFWAFFRFEPQLSESFVLQLVVFYVWFAGYCYLLAVLVVGLSRGVTMLRESSRTTG